MIGVYGGSAERRKIWMKKLMRGVLLTFGALVAVNASGQQTTATPAVQHTLDVTTEEVIEKSIEATGGREAYERLTK